MHHYQDANADDAAGTHSGAPEDESPSESDTLFAPDAMPPLHDPHSPHDDDASSMHEDIVGDPYNDARHWELQTTPFSCDVECQRGIIEALTGENVSEATLCTEAAERQWLTSADGTSLEDAGKLLELHGVHTHTQMHASIGDIYEELAEGHKVIVGVRGEDLWNAGNPFALPAPGGGANHAIWVTGIDKTDPSDPKVIINDSGDPEGAGKAYSLADFTNAWEKSDYFYLATDKQPPNLHRDTPDFDAASQTFPDMVSWAHEHGHQIETGAVLLGVAGLASRASREAPRRSPDPAPQSPASATPPPAAATSASGTSEDPAPASDAAVPVAEPPAPKPAPQQGMLAEEIRRRIERNGRERAASTSTAAPAADAADAPPNDNVVKMKARR